MNYEGTMDPECFELCEQMNRFPGVTTHESCCGHGQRPFRIWFGADSLEALPPLLFYCDSHGCGCHSGVMGWHVRVQTDCAASPVTFALEGPVGDYDGAEKIAAAMAADRDAAFEKGVAERRPRGPVRGIM